MNPSGTFFTRVTYIFIIYTAYIYAAQYQHDCHLMAEATTAHGVHAFNILPII
jgi:hypothetical protein